MNYKPTFSNDPDNEHIRTALSNIEPEVLREAFYVAQMALNDLDTAQMVSNETGIDISVIHSLTSLFIDLSIEPKEKPEITTIKELTNHASELKKLMKEVGC